MNPPFCRLCETAHWARDGCKFKAFKGKATKQKQKRKAPKGKA